MPNGLLSKFYLSNILLTILANFLIYYIMKKLSTLSVLTVNDNLTGYSSVKDNCCFLQFNTNVSSIQSLSAMKSLNKMQQQCQTFMGKIFDND